MNVVNSESFVGEGQVEVPNIDYDVTTMYEPKRLATETYEEYVLRRGIGNEVRKQMKKGQLIWDSSNKGTYNKKKHGELMQ